MRTQRTGNGTTYTYTYDGATLSRMTAGSNILIFTYGADDTPVSDNLLAYCGNNPVMYFDPTGNLPSWVTKMLISIAVIVDAAILSVETAGTGTIEL